MKHSTTELLIIALAFGTLTSLISVDVGRHQGSAGVASEQAKAVQAGVGNYELDVKTGQVVFKYVNLQEYTNWVVQQVRAPKGIPLQ